MSLAGPPPCDIIDPECRSWHHKGWGHLMKSPGGPPFIYFRDGRQWSCHSFGAEHFFFDRQWQWASWLTLDLHHVFNKGLVKNSCQKATNAQCPTALSTASWQPLHYIERRVWYRPGSLCRLGLQKLPINCCTLTAECQHAVSVLFSRSNKSFLLC